MNRRNCATRRPDQPPPLPQTVQVWKDDAIGCQCAHPAIRPLASILVTEPMLRFNFFGDRLPQKLGDDLGLPKIEVLLENLWVGKHRPKNTPWFPRGCYRCQATRHATFLETQAACTQIVECRSSCIATHSRRDIDRPPAPALRVSAAPAVAAASHSRHTDLD